MTLIETLKMTMAFSGTIARYLLWLLRERPSPDSGRIKAADIDIYFKRFGAGSPVLLLHGGFMFAETWAAQFPALSRGHLVIAPDSRGHGRTTLGTAEMTYRHMAEDFASLVDGLGLGPVHVVGHSDGGTTALALAIQRPDLVRSLVLLGAPFNTSNYSEEAWRGIEQFLRPAFPGLVSVRMARRLLSPEPERGGDFVGRMSRMWRELPDFTMEELGRITAPSLVVACDRDEFLSLWDDPLKAFRETAAAIPGAEMAVVRGGIHVVHMQKPRTVNRMILDFLAAHP